MFVVRKYFHALLIVSFTGFFVLLLLPSQIHADGGAPNVAYVSGTQQGISTIDIAQQKITGTFSLPGDPHTILLSVDGRTVYVTQPALNQVTVIAAKTQQTICTAHLSGQPSLLVIDPGTNTLYTAGNGATNVSALDPMTCAVKHTIRTNGSVYGLAVAIVGSGIAGGTGNQLWVADSSLLTAFDASGKQLLTIPIAGNPQYLSIPQGTTIYITTHQGTVEAVDLSSRKVFPSLLTGGTFGPMDYDATTGEIYVPDMQHSRIDVLTPISAGATSIPTEPSHTIAMPAAPQSIAITSDGQLGFVALANGNVVMLDIPGKQTVMTFHVGGTPHFIITGLYPSLLSLTPQQALGINFLDIALHYGLALLIAIPGIFLVVKDRIKYRQYKKQKRDTMI